MAKRNKKKSFDLRHLPTDLIYNTLSRLPVKTLIRFKSVCKTWYDLIDSRYFVEKHQKLQTTRALDSTFSYMLVTASRTCFKKKFSLLYFGDASYKLTESKSPFLSDRVSRVVGICNGLVCLCSSFSNPEYIICNPTTRKFRKITRAKLPRRRNNLLFLGFGSYANDYDIIRIVCTFVDTNSIREAPILRGELYTKGTDTWIEIEVTLVESSWLWRMQYKNLCITEAVVINEVFYWKDCCCDDPRVPFFDKRKRVFDVIKAPQNAHRYIDSQLHAIKNELALIVCNGDRFVVWVLNEDKTWTKMHTIDFSAILNYPLCVVNIRVLGSTRKGELVLAHRLINDNLRLYSYDNDSQDMKCLHNVDFDVAGFSLYTAYLYIEALTPVN